MANPRVGNPATPGAPSKTPDASTPSNPAPSHAPEPTAPQQQQGWIRRALNAVPKAGDAFQNAAREVKANVMANVHTAELLMAQVPGAVVNGIKAELTLNSKDALEKVNQSSPEQLAAMSDEDLGKLARALVNPSIAQKLERHGPDAAALSTAFVKVATAHGTDPGHVDGIVGRLPYGEDALDRLQGHAKAQLQALVDAGKAKPGDWNGFQSYLDTATGTQQRPGTQVTPLINGQVAFPKMYEAIDNAKSSVNLSVFAFQSDKTGWEMAKHLAAAADRGVQVRVIYDPKGSDVSAGKETDPAVYKFMRDHGVEVLAQTPGPMADHLTHRKITVIDGQTGFIGGMNVGDEYSTLWHDTHSEVKGPGVADLQKLFVEQWSADGGKPIPADQQKALFPPLSQAGAGNARIVGHVGNADQNMKLAYLRAIDTAQKTINLASPYFSDPDVMKHLEAAARRGVKVTIVLPKTNDEAVEQDAERAAYNELTGAGVKIYEYGGRPMAHEKVATFDGTIATIGSSNLDARSLGNNEEANVWSSDPSVAAQLDTQLFAQDLTQSQQVTQYKPGLFRSMKEDLVRRLAWAI